MRRFATIATIVCEIGFRVGIGGDIKADERTRIAGDSRSEAAGRESRKRIGAVCRELREDQGSREDAPQAAGLGRCCASKNARFSWAAGAGEALMEAPRARTHAARSVHTRTRVIQALLAEEMPDSLFPRQDSLLPDIAAACLQRLSTRCSRKPCGSKSETSAPNIKPLIAYLYTGEIPSEQRIPL